MAIIETKLDEVLTNDGRKKLNEAYKKVETLLTYSKIVNEEVNDFRIDNIIAGLEDAFKMLGDVSTRTSAHYECTLDPKKTLTALKSKIPKIEIKRRREEG